MFVTTYFARNSAGNRECIPLSSGMLYYNFITCEYYSRPPKPLQTHTRARNCTRAPTSTPCRTFSKWLAPRSFCCCPSARYVATFSSWWFLVRCFCVLLTSARRVANVRIVVWSGGKAIALPLGVQICRFVLLFLYSDMSPVRKKKRNKLNI